MVSNDKEALVHQEPVGFSTTHLLERIASLPAFREIATFGAKGELNAAQNQTQIWNQNGEHTIRHSKPVFNMGLSKSTKLLGGLENL